MLRNGHQIGSTANKVAMAPHQSAATRTKLVRFADQRGAGDP